MTKTPKGYLRIPKIVYILFAIMVILLAVNYNKTGTLFNNEDITTEGLIIACVVAIVVLILLTRRFGHEQYRYDKLLAS